MFFFAVREKCSIPGVTEEQTHVPLCFLTNQITWLHGLTQANIEEYFIDAVHEISELINRFNSSKFLEMIVNQNNALHHTKTSILNYCRYSPSVSRNMSFIFLNKCLHVKIQKLNFPAWLSQIKLCYGCRIVILLCKYSKCTKGVTDNPPP